MNERRSAPSLGFASLRRATTTASPTRPATSSATTPTITQTAVPVANLEGLKMVRPMGSTSWFPALKFLSVAW
jgi:hypothetical protein